MKTVADGLRWIVILGLWGVVTYLLWGIAWYWAAIWAVPGFYLVMNLVGFATLPLYYLVALSNPEIREAKQFLDDLERQERDSN